MKTREHKLTRSGIVVTIPDDWTVADTQASQRYGKGDVPKTNVALVQRVCLFDSEKWTINDIQTRIGGKDYNELMGELYGGEDEDESGEGDEAGNA